VDLTRLRLLLFSKNLQNANEHKGLLIITTHVDISINTIHEQFYYGKLIN